MNIRNLVVAAAVAAVAAVGAAAPANAHKDGTCHIGDLCYWNDINFQGSMIDYSEFEGDIADYRGDTFVSPGAGQGWRVKYKKKGYQQSVANYSPYAWASLWTEEAFTGEHLTLAPYGSHNFPWYFAVRPWSFRKGFLSHNWGS